MKLSLGFGVLFTLLAAGFLYLHYSQSSLASNLDKRGVITDGEVIRKFTKISSTTNSTSRIDSGPKNNSGPTSYFVEYEYETQGGRVVINEQNVGKEMQAAMEIGDFYKVKYDPINLETSSFVDINGGNAYQSGVKAIRLLLAIFCALSLISWWFYLKG